MILRAGLRLVTLADSVVTTITSYSRSPQNVTEAGGILIGSYRGPHVEILECSQPMLRDRRTRTMFDRCDDGHQMLAVKFWRDSGRTVSFVGEWHTHPEHRPSPSGIDLRTWRNVAKENIGYHTVFVIRGYDTWWAGISDGPGIVPLTEVSR